MNKYRIIKVETTNSLYETADVCYYIQKKFLWWWIAATIKYAYKLPMLHDGTFGVAIEKGLFAYDSIDEAKIILYKYLVNPFVENYKGNIIIGVVDINDLKSECFVNTSKIIERQNNIPCYEYCYTLEGLKVKIDKRTKTIKISVVS